MVDDPAKFLSWRPIISTMFVDRAEYTAIEFRELRADVDWRKRWRPAIREDCIGLPTPAKSYPLSSDNRIHHAFHILQFERTTQTRIESFKEILEFGGGYGDLARISTRLGFTGTYHIHDLPEFGALQRFYLAVVLKREVSSLDVGRPSISCSDDMGVAVQKTTRGRDPLRLFVATWSLSETPLDLRERWLAVIKEFSYFLIAFQHRFEGIDNEAWFAEMAQRRLDLAWKCWEIPHLRGHSYLIGRPASC